MKIVTWNVNSLRVRLEALLGLLQTEQPDIVALQEIKITDDEFPLEAFSNIGYKACYAGQKTFNGVAILTKANPCLEVETNFTDFDDMQRRVIAASCDNYRIINLYVPNGSELDSEKYQYKLQWLKACKRFIEQQMAKYAQVIVLGDFNIAPTNQDVWDIRVWQNRVLVSEPERAAFREILELGLVDVFRFVYPDNVEFSWWDYRAGAFHRNQGLRIDHILVNTELVKSCKECKMVREFRKHKRPSDHVPIIAEFVH